MYRNVWSVNAHINKLWKSTSHVITTRLKSWTHLISPTWRTSYGPGLLFFRGVVRKSRRQTEGIKFWWVRIDRFWVESDQRCDARVLFTRHSWAWFIQVAVDLVFRTSAWIVSLNTEVFRLSIPSLCLLGKPERAVVLWMGEGPSCLVLFGSSHLPFFPVSRGRQVKSSELTATWKILTTVKARAFQVRPPGKRGAQWKSFIAQKSAYDL